MPACAFAADSARTGKPIPGLQQGCDPASEWFADTNSRLEPFAWQTDDPIRRCLTPSRIARWNRPPGQAGESAVIASQYDHLGRRFTFAIESGNIALGYRPADRGSRLGSTFFFIDCRHGIAGAAVLEVLAESGSSEAFDALRIKPPLLQGATGCRCEATFGIAGNGTDVRTLPLRSMLKSKATLDAAAFSLPRG